MPTLNISTHITPEVAYEELIKKWTITLGAQGQRRSRGFMFGANPNGGGRGGASGSSPLIITATMMDLKVIEAGIQYYGDLLAMTKEEIDQFRHTYFQIHGIENMIFIWLDVKTSYSDSYLDLDRWTIFIEDDQGNQYEPKRIVEIPVSAKSQRFNYNQEEFGEEQTNWMRSFSWTMHEKYVSLYFPRVDFYDNSVLNTDTEYLKLVFFEWGKEYSRSEGFWWFSNN